MSGMCSFKTDYRSNGKLISNRAWFGEKYCSKNEILPGLILQNGDFVKMDQ
jgi:hypothetical protein